MSVYSSLGYKPWYLRNGAKCTDLALLMSTMSMSMMQPEKIPVLLLLAKAVKTKTECEREGIHSQGRQLCETVLHPF